MKTTKARVIAWCVFGLAIAALPISIAANSPEARATLITENRLSVPSPALSASSDAGYGVRYHSTKKTKKTPKKARKPQVCRLRILEQGGRPGHRFVIYCDRP